jgi:hypothetical protein
MGEVDEWSIYMIKRNADVTYKISNKEERCQVDYRLYSAHKIGLV